MRPSIARSGPRSCPSVRLPAHRRDRALGFIGALNVGDQQRLRAKVEHDPENPEIVVTVRGVGFRFGELENISVEGGELLGLDGAQGDRPRPVEPGDVLAAASHRPDW